jgi:hypothetical protein
MGTRNRDLPTCSIDLQPSTLPRAPSVSYIRNAIQPGHNHTAILGSFLKTATCYGMNQSHTFLSLQFGYLMGEDLQTAISIRNEVKTQIGRL